MGEVLLSEDFRNKMRSRRATGTVVCGRPFEMQMVLDFTGPRGAGSNLFYSFLFQQSKWGFKGIKKVDEWVEVTPEYVEFANLTSAQKQRLMEQIKSGLTSAAQAVTDYELLSHDARRYKEMIDYFKAGEKDDHVLRSLFVDRVDAHTGEGYSLVTMARRWPTIITDFMRMKKEWTNVKEIRKELDVSLAEASVLKTKNELYKEWISLFEPSVKERYSRIMAMVRSRKKSIDSYRTWLKPYVSRYLMIREKLEEKPTEFYTNPYFTPGFGQSQAITGIKLWVWKEFTPAELTVEHGPLRDFYYQVPGEKERKKISFLVNPYDKVVRKEKEKMESHYKVDIPDHVVYEDIIRPSVRDGLMDPHRLYYLFFNANIILTLLRTPPPSGGECDDLCFAPLEAWFMSQNALLVHLIEIYAREKAMEKYINELIGTEEIEKEETEKLEKMFEPPPKEPRFKGFKTGVTRFNKGLGGIGSALDRFVHLFILRGPYETVFYERISKMFARGIGGEFGKQTDFIKMKMGVE